MITAKSLLALLIFLPSCLADTLRVTTWNLQAQAGAGTSENRLQEAAAALKQINPDVILLQQVRDWKMCADLAQALKPDQYNVQVCSAFRDLRSGALSTQQVAILSRGLAYFSWSEAWRPQGDTTSPGGFAFAALQVGNQRLGFFSVQAGAGSAEQRGPARRAAVAQAQAGPVGQLLAQVGSATNWIANRVQIFVIAASFDPRTAEWPAPRDETLRLLEAADFGDAFFETPAAAKITVAGRSGSPVATADYILSQPAGCAANPRVLSVALCAHSPVTCDVELDPVKIAASQARRTEAVRTREARSAQPAQSVGSEPQTSTISYQLLWAAALVGIVVLAVLAWILARRRQRPAPPAPGLLTAGTDMPSSYTIIVGTRSATDTASAQKLPPPAVQPIIHLEAPGTTQTQAEALKRRTLAAERRAELANAVIRNGLIPNLGQWLKQKLVRKLIVDRAQMLETQQAAAHKALAVEERLARIEQQIQRQNAAYQTRIEELTRELIVAKEENRELIRARITQVKAEMEAARARLIAQSSADDESGG